MTLRTRVTLAAAVAVAASVVGVSLAVYVSIGDELRRQVDVTLREQGDRIASVPALPPIQPAEEPDPAVFTDSYFQAVDPDGRVLTWFGEGELPATDVARAVASGEVRSAYEEVTVAGTRVRVYAVATEGGAVRFGRSLEEVERSLERLTITLAAIGAVAIGAAAGLGRVAAGRAIAPVHAVSATARDIAATRDFSRRLPAGGRDEVASTAASFNEVLGALEASQALQRQLVADASHELRTPLTTLRTNVEVLARAEDLPPVERRRVLDDITGELGDLTTLVGDLVDLARDGTAERDREPVELGELVADVLERARRQRPGITFDLDADASVVEAAPDRLHRAVTNLVDNAAKWSPAGCRVAVAVAEGTVTVTDEGPGIDPADLPHVFDRFYRSAAARDLPGSGLGLAIVKQTAEALGGGVEARSGPGRGTTLVLRLPPLPRHAK